MKKYLEFINESVKIPHIVIRREFRELFPDKESYEKWAIDTANDIYGDFAEDDEEQFFASSMDQVDESIHNEMMELLLINLGRMSGLDTYYLSVDEREVLKEKIEKWIDKL